MARVDGFGKEKISFSLPGFEPLIVRSVGSSNAHHVMSVPNTLSAILNEGITLCLEINSFTYDVRQHNLFILE